MKSLIALLLLTATIHSFAQTIIAGKILNAIPGVKISVNVPFGNRVYTENIVSTAPDEKGGFNLKISLQYGQFIIVTYGDIRLKIYVEPRLNTSFVIDAKDYKKSLHFSGALSAENKFCVTTGLSFFTLIPATYNDTITAPNDILTAMQAAQKSALGLLDKTNVGATFRKTAIAEIAYWPAAQLLSLSFKNNAWTTSAADNPRYALALWRKAIVQAYDANPINNDNAISSYNYAIAIDNLSFITQRRYNSKDELVPLAENIMGIPFDSIGKQLHIKGKSYFEFKTLIYYLHGVALQKALACFIDKEIHEGELESMEEAYNYFIDSFGNSRYIAHVKQAANGYLSARNAAVLNGYHFITDSTITFAHAIAAFKGNVIYIDLWGTWCPACRDEMHYVKDVQAKYKGKPVTFVYIAVEHNTSPEKNWKETVHFFNIPGTHILANNTIRTYIEEMYKDGHLVFPSYILLDKNGNIVNKNAHSPSEKEMLYKQIDELL